MLKKIGAGVQVTSKNDKKYIIVQCLKRKDYDVIL